MVPGLSMLARGRVHEATGPGRRSFAAALAGEAVLEAGSGRSSTAVLWIIEAREGEILCPAGLAPLLDPARLLIARPTGMLAVLQVAEEALRSSAVAMVIAELDAAPDLTASRRLQLAAGTGAGRGLCLVPEGRLATNASETRWHCSPVNPSAPPSGAEATGQSAARGPTPVQPIGALQHWELVKNKRGPLAAWQVMLGGVWPGRSLSQPAPVATSSAREQQGAQGAITAAAETTPLRAGA